MRIKIIGLAILASALFSTCVPQKKYLEEQTKRQSAEAERDKLKAENSDYATKSAELDRQLTENKKQTMLLQNDTLGCGMRYRLLSSQYDQLTANYELLLKQNKDLMNRQTTENNQLVGKLNLSQEQLIQKEDSLKRMQRNLYSQKHSLDSLTIELRKREMRVNELQSALNTKDSAIAAIQNKVKNALLSFEGKGLTVHEKDGKVYVSMDEKLLFSSGSIVVQPEGVKALKQLAKVLEQNADISIMVEGHTDDLAYKGVGDMKDNWDLSVMRATSVVKILLSNGNIDPKRITAAGRGEYFPLDPAKTTDARAKNRRTEIILTPKLDELFKVLDQTSH
ncbi:MAG: OmpA family protein [Bacteroidetes bacterium]|jgi:chemotaxis protein MotB|nr:OmpA family protein [Bacteroidota bacterium]